MKVEQFESTVREFIATQGLLPTTEPVLVALSGGADSVALLRVLLALGHHCVAAHCNFHLRGEESLRDERFVRELCKGLGVPLSVRQCDVDAYRRRHSVSVEMACRELRYAWFEEERVARAAQAVAVAHHRDDNVETLLHNLLRGTGIAGLRGMLPRRDAVVRPLLCVGRDEVIGYLAELRQPYVTDSTNLHNDYTRNRIRNVLLPAIEGEFPGARHAIATTMHHLGEVEQLATHCATQAVQQVTTPRGFRLGELLSFPAPHLLVYEALRHSGFTMSQCHDVVASLRGDLARHPVYYSSTHCLTLCADEAIVEPIVADQAWEQTVDLRHPTRLRIALSVQHGGEPFSPTMCDGKRHVAFDTALLNCSLVLRSCRTGDCMRPFGMRGTRLVSDLLTEARYTRQQKRQVCVLEADGTIVWLVGVRAADTMRVTPGSTHYVLLSC